MLRSCALASVAAFGLVGCALDFDAIGFTGTGGEGASSVSASVSVTTGTGAGSTATGPGTCEAGACSPPAPAGWVGPGALFEGRACPAGQVPLFEGGDEGTAGYCPCSPVGAFCTNATVGFFDNDECMATSVSSALIPSQDVCQPNPMLFEEPVGGDVQAEPLPSPGVCQVDAGFVPEVSYSVGRTSICGFEPVPSGCGKDATCVPSGIACIAAPDPAGVATCPDDYPTLRTHKNKITPTCTGCRFPPDLDCAGTIEIHDDAMCQGTPLGNMIVDAPPSCQGLLLSTGTLYLKYVLATQPSCAPGDPVLASDAWAVCCQ